MKFEPTEIGGLMRIRLAKAADERGTFARLWCGETFAAAGVPFTPVQLSTAFNIRAATLRGMHWQAAPHGETKLIRVIRGRLWDVIVDVRPRSPSYRRWLAFDLDCDGDDALLVPPGCAHGYITLSDATEVLYAMDAPQMPQAARGARWNDPAFAIAWPREPAVMSDRDRNWPDFAVEVAP